MSQSNPYHECQGSSARDASGLNPEPADRSANLGRGRKIVDWLAANLLPASARRSPEEIDLYLKDERRSWD